MLSIVILLITLVSMSPVFSSENEKEVAEWLHTNQCQMNSYLDEANQLKNDAESKIATLFAEANKEQNLTCSKALTCSKGEFQTFQETNTKPNNSILIFVSLSMPKESLISLYKEAEQNNLTLIILGLKNNSFKETALALQELGVSLQIDPNLFEEYEIKETPTFVSVTGKEPLKLKGNVSLSYALKKFKEES